jgi:hypothetical protein
LPRSEKKHPPHKLLFIGQYRLVILSERSESKDPFSPQKESGFFDFVWKFFEFPHFAQNDTLYPTTP